jgi:hypothetical protein
LRILAEVTAPRLDRSSLDRVVTPSQGDAA